MAFEGRWRGAVDGKGPYEAPKSEDYYKYRQNDNISHFICRLAYCRNEELRKWLLQQETRLFQMRLGATEAKDIKELLASNLGIHYQSVVETDDVWIKHKEDITFNQVGIDAQKPDNYIKVPFKEALTLVGRRQVFLHKGIAYVPIRELQSIAAAHFRARLSSELMRAYKYLPSVLKDARLRSFQSQRY